MNWPLALAALLMAGGCAYHASATRRLIGPVRASDLPGATRWLAELCWHFVTLTFAIMAAALAAGTLSWLGPDAIRLCAVLAGAVAILCGASALQRRMSPWRHPASYLLGAVALLALLGG